MGRRQRRHPEGATRGAVHDRQPPEAIMKPLPLVLAVLLTSGCAAPYTVAPSMPAPQATPVSAPQYPDWLEMKPGYAEACISGGGCIPMTQAELNAMAAALVQRTLQACRRSQSI